MKKLSNIFLSLLVLVVITSGCESLLDTKTDSLVFPDEHQLNSPNDTLYSMIGIFSKLEKLADRYVLLGELRSDLMDVTSNTSPSLLEIYNHNISENNPYNKIEDYYGVINNCNYLISNIDTSIVAKGEKVMYKEYAAAKAIRAWTYMQICLNYGSVKYFEHPILSISEVDNYSIYSLTELIPVLIKDLEPWKEISLPGEISLGEIGSSRYSYFPVSFVLGDLYLWSGKYEEAAKEYYDLIKNNSYLIHIFLRSTWTVEKGVFVEREFKNTNWPFVFSSGVEQITIIPSSTEYGKGAELDSITTTKIEIIPSAVAIDNWNNQLYYNTTTQAREGDLRGDMGSYLSPKSASYINSESKSYFDYLDFEGNFNTSGNAILKYFMMTGETARFITIYRSGLLYLRYAEAVNRAGKPNLAFATLKNGLNSKTMAVDTIVPPREKYSYITTDGGVFYDYVNFEDIVFDYNIGIHGRGCGNIQLSKDFVIEEQSSLQDSIEWVENKIIEELALETAFEGNRFHDLMRISLRRTDPSFLADKVSKKYSDNQEAIRTKLLDENNWYLK